MVWAMSGEQNIFGLMLPGEIGLEEPTSPAQDPAELSDEELLLALTNLNPVRLIFNVVAETEQACSLPQAVRNIGNRCSVEVITSTIEHTQNRKRSIRSFDFQANIELLRKALKDAGYKFRELPPRRKEEPTTIEIFIPNP